MPAKKKKKGKGGKKGGDDGKLPPPPNLDNSRQGALEALLKFRINGREDIIEQYQEDSEVIKEKNEQLKEKNHYLRIQRGEHYKSLVKQAKIHEEGLENAPSVEKETVEKALTEKLHLAKKLQEDLEDCKRSIEETDKMLEVKSEELRVWTFFKDVTEGQNSARISFIKEKLKSMLKEQEALKSEYEVKLVEAKLAIDKRCTAQMERQKELTSERFLNCMDEDVKGELSDNAWLKNEIVIAKETVGRLSSEVDALERRNLRAIEMVTKEKTSDVENTREIYLATNRKSLEPPSTSETPKQAGDGSGLPSLVNITQCTNDRGPGGQAGQLEMKLLSMRGHKATVIPPPETFHLPPLDQQLATQSAVPPRSAWPVSNSMLKSLVK